MNEISIVKDCIICNEIHAYLVTFEKYPVFASSGVTSDSIKEEIICKCPNKNRLFTKSISVPQGKGYEYEGISLGDIVEMPQKVLLGILDKCEEQVNSDSEADTTVIFDTLLVNPVQINNLIIRLIIKR